MSGRVGVCVCARVSLAPPLLKDGGTPRRAQQIALCDSMRATEEAMVTADRLAAFSDGVIRPEALGSQPLKS